MSLTADSRNNGVLIGTANGTITSPSFTVNSPSSPLIVGIRTVQVATVGNPSWNGQSMGAAVLSKNWSSGGTYKMVLYILKNPTPGTGTITTSITGGLGGEVSTGFYISTLGGDTTTGYRTIYSQNGGTVGPGLTVVDSQNGDLVFHLADVFAGTITFDGGETSTSTEIDGYGGGGGQSGGISTKAAVGSNTIVGCTDAADYAEIAFALIPSGGPQSISASTRAFAISGPAATLRVGSTVFLRYRK